MADSGQSQPGNMGADEFSKNLRDEIVDRSTRWQRRRQARSPLGGVIVGLAVATLGVLLLLQNLGIPQFEHIGDYWPVILIVLGTARAIGGGCLRGKVWGGLIVAAGVLFLAHNLGYIHGNLWRLFWPLMLVGLGFVMLVGAIERRKTGGRGGFGGGPRSSARVGTANTLNEWATFGGVRRRIESQDFEGGEANAMCGGIELDLSRAGTKKDELVIEANAIFGGIDMRVPESWEVSVQGSGIFGGYEDQTVQPRVEPTGRRPHLTVTGHAIFGGVSVKN